MEIWGTFCYTACMDHQEYMHSIRHETPTDEDYDVVSRSYKNTAGADELIFLPDNYWDNVDWLEARGDIDFSEWVIHCEETPCEGYTLSHLLMHWLWKDHCYRYMMGEPMQSALPPLGGAVVYGEYAGFSWWLDRNEIASSIANANHAL